MNTNTNFQTVPVSAAKADAVAGAYEAYQNLLRMWQQPGLGLVLVNAYFNEKPMTTDQLAERCGVSDETIRRWLKPLIAVDRVRVISEGRNIFYKAREEWANRTAEMMMRVHDEVASRRGSTADLPVARLVTVGGHHVN